MASQDAVTDNRGQVDEEADGVEAGADCEEADARRGGGGGETRV